jgi:S1-C subfamily serine protease
MTEQGNWAFPKGAQPRQDELRFDLDSTLDAVVQLRSEIPEDAFTASILGTERAGNGVVIRDDGLVLTIGYLITEAQSIWLTTNSGVAIAGYPLAYDQVTGFGLVQPLGRLGVPALPRGSATSCAIGDDVIVIGHGGHAHALKAKIIGRREFAGYWEYVLEEALYTAPAHPQWGGAAVVGMDGLLLGIGSLLVEEVLDGKQTQGNMIVPIDLIEPILDDMTKLGRPNRPPRPWLGMYATQAGGQIVIAGLAQEGPAHRAGLRQGDMVLEVASQRVASLADLFRRVWRLGAAGTEIPLTVARDGSLLNVRLQSIDRNEILKKPLLH